MPVWTGGFGSAVIKIERSEKPESRRNIHKNVGG